MPVVAHHDELVGDDGPIGAEGHDDVDVAVEQRLILQTEVDQADVLEGEAAVRALQARQPVATLHEFGHGTETQLRRFCRHVAQRAQPVAGRERGGRRQRLGVVHRRRIEPRRARSAARIVA